MGKIDSENPLIRQLMVENANTACQAALRGKSKVLDLNGIIRLCNEIDSFEHKLAKSFSLAIGAVLQKPSGRPGAGNRGCFHCGQEGHFAHECTHSPGTTQSAPLGGSQQAVPGLCPRCCRGRHWARDCRSKTDVNGQILPAIQENGSRVPL